MDKQTLRKAQLAHLQRLELDILKQFIAICQTLNLTYYVIGGTLLGAVRHKGFIPWDDDIDVGMPRKDYEIFLQKAQSLLDDPYFLQTHETDPQYPMNFAKLRNSNTTFIETSMANRNINHGVYIDIFPLDYYPASKLKQVIFDMRLKLLHFRMRQEFIIPKQYKVSILKRILQTVCMFSAKCIYPSAETAMQMQEKLIKSSPQSPFLANFCGAWGKKEIVPTSYFRTYTPLLFEGLEVRGPVETHQYLTHIYGNYMKLPSEAKQVAHHYTDVIDLTKAFSSYIVGGHK